LIWVCLKAMPLYKTFKENPSEKKNFNDDYNSIVVTQLTLDLKNTFFWEHTFVTSRTSCNGTIVSIPSNVASTGTIGTFSVRRTFIGTQTFCTFVTTPIIFGITETLSRRTYTMTTCFSKISKIDETH
jgi:hypothetical protein